MDHGLARRGVPEFANSNHSTAQAIAAHGLAATECNDVQALVARWAICNPRLQGTLGARSGAALIAALQAARSNNLCAAAKLTTPETSARQ
jgi:hypothetical protein